MPRDGNGAYSPPLGSWTTGVTNGEDATIADWLALLNDLTYALTQSLSKDGQTAMTGNLSMGGKKITNLADAAFSGDAVSLGVLTAMLGLTASFANKVITYAKIQDITATQRLLGRNTAGAGVTEEVTVSQLLDWVGSTVNSLLIRGASNWELTALKTLNGASLLGSGDILIPTRQIQPVAASVDSNALTLTLNPTILDFRSATLTSGSINTRVLQAAISLVVPSGATLGTVSTIAGRLAILAIDNAGTVELAVTNLASSPTLDETTLISTTAISASANSAGVIYSTSTRSNVPFRVVGFVDITETTAGTWATAPSQVQGSGGLALTALSSIGYGQTWQNVTRVSGTTYYNTTGRPIGASVQAGGTGSIATTITVDGVVVMRDYSYNTVATVRAGVFAIIPPGSSYEYGYTNGTVSYWELR